MAFYRPIFRQAWSILGKVKHLWALGLFAVLYVGPAGEYSLLSSPTFRAYLAPRDNLELLRQLFAADAPATIVSRLREVIQLQPFELSIVLSVFALLTLLVTGLIVLAQAGLVRGIGQAVRGKPEHLALTIERVWPSFGRTFVILVGSFFAVNLLVFLLSLPFWVAYILHPSTTPLVLVELIVIFLFLPAFFAISFLSKYALAFVVLEGRTTWSAVVEAWDLFRRNWLATLEMALLLAGLNIVLAYLVLAVPLPLVLSNAVLGRLLFELLLFGFGMLFTVFQFTCWVLLFFKLREGRMVSKLTRIFTGRTIPARPLPRQT